MLRRLFDWFIADNSDHYTLNNRIAVVIMTAIFALCFDLLAPQMAPVIAFADMELSDHAASTSGSNKFNQLFWVAMMGLACVCALRDPKRFQAIVLSQWPLALMVILALCSTLWALNGGIAFRRAVLFIFIVTAVVAGIGFLRTPNQLLLILYRIGAAVLLLNLVTIATGNFDKDGYFYGIHGQKNSLGAVALLSIYFAIAVRTLYRERCNLTLNSLYLISWMALLILSVSKTSIALMLLAPTLVFCLNLFARYFQINLGVLLITGSVLLLIALQMILGWQDWHLKQFAAQVMSDPSLTGRDYIWAFLLERIEERWLLGYGYGSFWGIGDQSPNVIYGQSYLQLLNQGHNGYLDLLAILGVVGLVVYGAIVAQFVYQSEQIRQQHPQLFFLLWILLVITLIHNITESSLMRGSHAMWIIQLLVFISTARLVTDKRILRCPPA